MSSEPGILVGLLRHGFFSLVFLVQVRVGLVVETEQTEVGLMVETEQVAHVLPMTDLHPDVLGRLVLEVDRHGWSKRPPVLWL